MTRTAAQIAAEQARNESWKTIQIRVTPAEYKQIKKSAGKRPVSGYVRTLVRKAVGIGE